MKKIIIIFLFPFVVFPQEVLIKHLSENINTKSAEINFVQTNDTTAYFTVITESNGILESNIYTTSFMNGEWGKKKYSKYNSDRFNAANISFLDGGRTFFTIYNNEMLEGKIVCLEQIEKDAFYEPASIYSDQFFNTQPFISSHNSQKVLYFVSDREGGFGGQDIWLSIINDDGNFGVPINAGNKINTAGDEVTPFYNKYEGAMYFSSNKKGGSGGFDIYKAKGSLNLWGEAKNAKKLNSNQDELYLTFYDEYSGYFASNRDGANFESAEYCCNDIFSFKYSPPSEETQNLLSETYKYLPLDLYFHNDEPDPRTMNRTTKKTYKEAYISYFKMKTAYEKENPMLNNFFEEILQQNFNRLNKVLELLLFDLKNENKMEIQIRGYASPLHSPQYNENLSQRRISSVINYIRQFKNGALNEYIFSKELIITELPFGERKSSEKVSDDANDKKKSVYSIEAMLERKIEIVDVILKEKNASDLNKKSN